MVISDVNGWFWHLLIYNPISHKKEAFNSKCFPTKEEAVEDLVRFVREMGKGPAEKNLIVPP